MKAGRLFGAAEARVAIPRSMAHPARQAPGERFRNICNFDIRQYQARLGIRGNFSDGRLRKGVE